MAASTALAYQKILALPALLAPNSSRSLLSDTQRPIVARRHSQVCPKPWDFCPRPWDFCPKPWDKSGKPGFFTIPEVLGASSATKNAVNTRIVRPAFHVTSVDAAIHGLWRQPRKNPGAPIQPELLMGCYSAFSNLSYAPVSTALWD